MPHAARTAIGLVIAITLFAGVVQHLAADKPDRVVQPSPPEISLPADLPPIENPAHPTDTQPTDVEQKIRRALGGAGGAGGGLPTGDGVLNDVLDLIKQRGSVLDGSSLDERIPGATGAGPESDRNALVAEQLLKAARLLRSLNDPDERRTTLIRQLRREAEILLSK